MIITTSEDLSIHLMMHFFKDLCIPVSMAPERRRRLNFYTGESALRCIIVLLGKDDNLWTIVENIKKVIAGSPSDRYQKIVFVNVDCMTNKLMDFEGRIEDIECDLPQEMFRDGDQFSPHDSDNTWGFDKLFHFVVQNAVTKLVAPNYQYVSDEYWIVDHEELTNNEKEILLSRVPFPNTRFLAYNVEAAKDFFSLFLVNIEMLCGYHMKRKRSFIVNPKNILGGESTAVLSLRHIIETVNNTGKTHNDFYGTDSKVKNSRKIVFYAINRVGMGHASRVSKIVRFLLKQEKNIHIHVICHVGCESFFEGMDIQLTIVPPSSHRHNHMQNRDMHRVFVRALRDANVFIFDGVYFDTFLVNALNAVFDGQSIWLRRGLRRRDDLSIIFLCSEYFADHVICPAEIFPEINNRDMVHHVIPDLVGAVYDDPDETLSDDTKNPVYDIVVGLGSLDLSFYKNLIDAILYFSLMHPHLKIFFLAWPYAHLSHAISSRKDKSKNVEVGFVPNAISIMRTSRFFIGMTGYNSFTEVIVNRIPSILYPAGQKDTDLQIFRAHTAAQHGVALMGEWNMFGLIQQMEAMLNDRFYDSIRDKLKALSLPKPGQEEISKKIIACIEKT